MKRKVEDLERSAEAARRGEYRAGLFLFSLFLCRRGLVCIARVSLRLLDLFVSAPDSP